MGAGGIPHQALRKTRAADALVMSQPVFDEVFDGLHRPQLARFVDATLRTDLLDQLLSGMLWFEVTATVTDCRDATDNKYLEWPWQPRPARSCPATTTCSSCTLGARF
jgi:predicted nucleic acid-binding protein